ncbi:hypothetical protein [Sphingomonas bacterium]|uniref:hypothetical protein n=1 Tax=Sphingomonas bacterium TaxID=1895847 RepID=UPI002626DD8B|nr:hypothetical protein [Sphingomonas bacterium]MDB5678502.1 hypothetical protein [Sphingomonas bacterium]
MNKYLMLLSAPMVLAATPAPQAVQLSSTVMVEKTVSVGGREQVELQKPTNVLPGDKLIFQTNYRNAGGQPATQFVVTNPVPAAVAWTGEATPGAVESVDGGRSYAPLSQLKVKGANGALRPAQPADVTHIRWTLASIAPGASGLVKYRGMVR